MAPELLGEDIVKPPAFETMRQETKLAEQRRTTLRYGKTAPYMIALAIDTCEIRGSVAVLRDAEIVRVVPHSGEEEYSSWLLPTVDLALTSSKIALADVDLFAAASGPGSFTGVRVGLTTVKAWSEVFGKPIVAVSRLEAIAAQSAHPAPYVAAFIDAYRGQIFGALYKKTDQELSLVGTEMVSAPDFFLDWVDNHIAGSKVAWISTDADIVAQHPAWQGRALIQRLPCTLAPLIGTMAFHRASQGKVLDALTVDANYVRRSYVENFQKGPADVSAK